MDIEALVKKHVRLYRAGAHYSVRVAMRAALLELESNSIAAVEVVAWRCKDYGDGWILYHDNQIAANYQAQTECMMQSLVVQPDRSITTAELDVLRDKATQLDRERRANDKMAHDHRVLMARVGERDDRIHQLKNERDELLLLLKKVDRTPLTSWYSSGLNSEVFTTIACVEAAIAQEKK